MKNVYIFSFKDLLLLVILIFLAEAIASTSNETDTRKLRSRRPNPKYANEQFETEYRLLHNTFHLSCSFFLL